MPAIATAYLQTESFDLSEFLLFHFQTQFILHGNFILARFPAGLSSFCGRLYNDIGSGADFFI